MPHRAISVVVPVYNEHENIGTCLRGLWSALQGVEHEILVVYDFAGDTTLAAIREMADAPPTLKLVENQIGRGAANAIRAGFQAARGDVVVTTMADLCDPPQKILELADEMRRSGAAVVAAARYMHGGSQQGGPLIKRALSRLAGLSLHWIGGVGTHDATNNFKAYSRSFLDHTQIEAQGAFDIGLELAVKAHLAGELVSEVPTSWKDRSAGESRFKVAAWAPKYLRWYWRAMLAPVCVGLVWLLAWLMQASTSDWTGGVVGIEPTISAAFGLAGLGSLLLARALRGRTIAWDALLALAWCNPLHAKLVHAGWWYAGLFLAATASAAVLVATVPRAAWNRGLARARQHLCVRSALFVLLSVAAWGYLVQVPYFNATVTIDTSWQRAFDQQLVRGARSGVESIFTYGPLGAVHSWNWLPNVFWAQLVLQQGLIKLVGAAFLVGAGFALRSWFERLVCCAAVAFATLAMDVSVLVVVASIGAVLLSREKDSRFDSITGAVMLAAIALQKFTFQMLCGTVVALLVLQSLQRRDYQRAALRLAVFAFAFVALWLAAGQHLVDLPMYWKGSLEISAGYTHMPRGELPTIDWTPPLIVIGLLGVACIARLWASRASPRALSLCVLVAAAMFLCFKAAYFYRPPNDVFAEAGSLLPVLLLVGLERAATRRWAATWIARGCITAAIVMSIMGTRTATHIREYGWYVTAKIGGHHALDAWRMVLDASALREKQLGLEATAVQSNDLPRIRAAVGHATIDTLGYDQGLLLLNGLAYRGRPVLQAYSVYTPWLLERNVEWFEGANAPEFLLLERPVFAAYQAWVLEPRPLETVLRMYRPALFERGHLLLRRDPQRASRARPREDVVLERQIEVDQWIDLPAPADGRLQRVTLDMRDTLFGRVRNFATLGAAPSVELRLDDGRKLSSRISPDVARDGWLISPLATTGVDLQRWLCGRELPRVVALRWRNYPGQRGLLENSARMVVSAYDDVIRRPAFDPTRFEFPMCHPVPTEVKSTGSMWMHANPPSSQLLGGLPMSMRWDLPAGSWRLHGRVGTFAGSGLAVSDGIRVHVRVRTADGAESELYARELAKPKAVGKVRGVMLNEVFELPEGGSLTLAFDCGSAGECWGDFFALGPLSVRPVGAHKGARAPNKR
jgi:hypothetical protein